MCIRDRKNASLAKGDAAEPRLRVIGEQQVVAEADRLVANTDTERNELITMYDADPGRVDIVTPGADLDCYTPGSRSDARAELGLPAEASIVTFVGRIQPLKAPDVLLAAAAPRHGLEFLARECPRRLRLVLPGRSDPPLPIARLRLTGRLVECGRADGIVRSRRGLNQA